MNCCLQTSRSAYGSFRVSRVVTYATEIRVVQKGSTKLSFGFSTCWMSAADSAYASGLRLEANDKLEAYSGLRLEANDKLEAFPGLRLEAQDKLEAYPTFNSATTFRCVGDCLGCQSADSRSIVMIVTGQDDDVLVADRGFLRSLSQCGLMCRGAIFPDDDL